MLRIIVVDDHTLFRAGVVKLLQAIPEVEIVGEAANGRQAVQLVSMLRPDVVTMDLAMYGLNGLEATACIRAQFPNTKVIVLSMHANEEYLQAALKAGASGYILKRSTPDDLKLAVQTVARGGLYLSALVAGSITWNPDAASADNQGDDARLTNREEQVLLLLARGQSTEDIALALRLSIKTVESHRAELMRRLDDPNAAELCRYAARLSPLSG